MPILNRNDGTVLQKFYAGKVLFYTPRKQSLGVYSDPYVRPLVRPSVCPSQSLIRYSSKTTEQNFMNVHYMMRYCTSYFKFLF